MKKLGFLKPQQKLGRERVRSVGIGGQMFGVTETEISIMFDL